MDADDVVAAPASWWSGWQFPEDDNGLVLESGSSYCSMAMSGLDWYTSVGTTESFGSETEAHAAMQAAAKGDLTREGLRSVAEGGFEVDYQGAQADLPFAAQALGCVTVGTPRAPARVAVRFRIERQPRPGRWRQVRAGPLSWPCLDSSAPRCAWSTPTPAR